MGVFSTSSIDEYRTSLVLICALPAQPQPHLGVLIDTVNSEQENKEFCNCCLRCKNMGCRTVGTLRCITVDMSGQNFEAIEELCYDLCILSDKPKKDAKKSPAEGGPSTSSDDPGEGGSGLNARKVTKKKPGRAPGMTIFKPGECMKYMIVEMHPELLDCWYAGDIEPEVTASGAKILISSDLFDPGLVLWKRSVPPTMDSIDRQGLTWPQEVVDRGLYLMPIADVVPYVSEHTFTQFIANVSDMVGMQLTVVIIGDQQYFKSAPKKKDEANPHVMTEADLQKAMTDLHVTIATDTALVNTANELALLIVQLTKAIAEAPYKMEEQECDDEAEFFMRGENKKCVAVDKDGNGLNSLWQQMIAVLPLSSLVTSRALCAQYKTPSDLYEALKTPRGLKRIADLGVTRSAFRNSKARRIGPEFARKLHTLFTAEDGNTLIE